MKYTSVGINVNSVLLLKNGWGVDLKKKHALFIIDVIN